MAEIDNRQEEEIHKLNKQLLALIEIREMVSESLGNIIRPLLEKNDLPLDLELDELLTAPGYWQFEVRRRIRFLRELDKKGKGNG